MADQFDSFDEAAAPEAPKAEVHLADYLDVVLKRRKLILVCLDRRAAGRRRPHGDHQADLQGHGGPRRQPAAINPARPGERSGQRNRPGVPPEPDPAHAEPRGRRTGRPQAQSARRSGLQPEALPSAIGPTRRARRRKPSDEDIIDAAIDVQGSIEALIVRPTTLVQLSSYDAPSPNSPPTSPTPSPTRTSSGTSSHDSGRSAQSSEFLTTQIEQAEGGARREGERAPGLRPAEGHHLERTRRRTRPLQKLEASEPGSAPPRTADRVAKEARYDEVRNARRDARRRRLRAARLGLRSGVSL